MDEKSKRCASKPHRGLLQLICPKASSPQPLSRSSVVTTFFRCTSAIWLPRGWGARGHVRTVDRHRGRKEAGPNRKKRKKNRAATGTFNKTGNDYTGEIFTCSVQAKDMRIDPDQCVSGEHAPRQRVLVGLAEIGSAQSTQSNEDRAYLRLKLASRCRGRVLSDRNGLRHRSV